MKRILSVLLSVALIFGVFSGCADKNYPVTVAGVQITEPPQRVVAFSEQAASAMFALGYKSYLVGAPSEFLKTPINGVEDIGQSFFIDYEKVYELEPDIIITPLEPAEEYQKALKLRNIKTVILETPTQYSQINEYYKALSMLLLGAEKYTEAYEPFTTENERIIAQLKTSNASITKRVAVFIENGFPITGDTLAGDALKAIGINNIAQDQTDCMMSFTDIKAADPEVIFCAVNQSEELLKSDSYKEITAVKNGAVYEIDMTALAFAGEGFISVLQDISTYLSRQ